MCARKRQEWKGYTKNNMRALTEIRWHGRGGQGAKTAALLLADVAFNTGKYVQGFPEYGPERMGAPITAYDRISDTPIRVHSNIYEPDFVVVVDDTLLHSVDVTKGWLKIVEENESNDKCYDWGFALKENGYLIGSGGIFYKEEDGAWEIGYNFMYDYWNKGYATEAAKAMLEFGINELNIKEFVA